MCYLYGYAVAVDIFKISICCTDTLSDWSDWTECSIPCGGGRQVRNRTCLSVTCSDDLYDMQTCNEEPCERMLTLLPLQWLLENIQTQLYYV